MKGPPMCDPPPPPNKLLILILKHYASQPGKYWEPEDFQQHLMNKKVVYLVT